MYFVYILESLKTTKHYTGSTSNLEKRLVTHNRGGNISTKRDKPWKVVYTEKFGTKNEAEKREREIKRYKGGNSFKNLIKPGWRSGQTHQTVNLAPERAT